MRTATGQTGRDAYVFEATAIANAQRELDERFRALLTVVHDEAPELFAYSSDYCPVFTEHATSARGFVDYVKEAVA